MPPPLIVLDTRFSERFSDDPAQIAAECGPMRSKD